MSKQIRLKPTDAAKYGLEINKGERYRVSEDLYDRIVFELGRPNKRKFKKVIRRLDKNGIEIGSIEKLQSKPIETPEGFEIIKISTSKTTGQQWVQYAPKAKEKEIKDFDFEAIIKKHVNPVKIKAAPKRKYSADFQTVTITDVHIGMDTDKYKNSMYAVEWNKEEVLKSAAEIVESVIKDITAPILYVDELGDLLDGYNAKTTRGGHDLPQNMTNEEAFDTALSFKMALCDNLVQHFEKVVFNNICNDNHAGAFGYFVNSSFKSIAELKYNTEVNNYRQFINHYYVNDICFVITHGKDDKSLKFGFKPDLKPPAIEKIDQYCKNNDIYKIAKLIVFKKGDSHQCLLDMASSDDFYYFNYPALSPSSQWVQNNFKKGRRGFVKESYNGVNVVIQPVFK